MCAVHTVAVHTVFIVFKNLLKTRRLYLHVPGVAGEALDGALQLPGEYVRDHTIVQAQVLAPGRARLPLRQCHSLQSANTGTPRRSAVHRGGLHRDSEGVDCTTTGCTIIVDVVIIIVFFVFTMVVVIIVIRVGVSTGTVMVSGFTPAAVTTCHSCTGTGTVTTIQCTTTPTCTICTTTAAATGVSEVFALGTAAAVASAPA